MKRSDRLPLTEFKDWLRTQGLAPGTVQYYATRVRGALREISGPEDAEGLAKYTASCPRHQAYQLSAAWGKYVEFLSQGGSNVSTAVTTGDDFTKLQLSLISALPHLDPVVLQGLLWKNVLLDFEPHGISDGPKWYDLNAQAVHALKTLGAMLKTVNQYDPNKAILTRGLMSPEPLALSTLYRYRRLVGIQKSVRQDIVENFCTLLQHRGMGADDINEIRDLVQAKLERIGETRVQSAPKLVAVPDPAPVAVPEETIRPETDEELEEWRRQREIAAIQRAEAAPVVDPNDFSRSFMAQIEARRKAAEARQSSSIQHSITPSSEPVPAPEPGMMMVTPLWVDD